MGAVVQLPMAYTVLSVIRRMTTENGTILNAYITFSQEL
jgi:hypothetical protein